MVRTISAAYDIAILVDQEVSATITVHLDSVGLLKGFQRLQVPMDLKYFKKGLYIEFEKIERGENYFSSKEGLVSIDVQNKGIQEFIKEYAANTNLNILIDPNIKAKISGRLEGLSPFSALVSLMQAHGFRVLQKENFFLLKKIGIQERRGFFCFRSCL